jgi:hypothetical protein
VKLLLEDVYKLAPVPSLIIVLGLLAGGIVLSALADRRDARRGRPPEEESRQARLRPRENP